MRTLWEGAADRETVPAATAVVMQDSAALQHRRQQRDPLSSPDCNYFNVLILAEASAGVSSFLQITAACLFLITIIYNATIQVQ